MLERRIEEYEQSGKDYVNCVADHALRHTPGAKKFFHSRENFVLVESLARFEENKKKYTKH